MPNTYTQIHIQFVFAVKYRKAMIHASWKEELYKYMTIIIQSYGHKLITMNGMEDHIHILVGLRPTQSISDLMQFVKSGSSAWINKNKIKNNRFEWQEGYGAFSYAKSQLKNVIAYINNQEKHHAKKSFREEYIEHLEKFEIDYDLKYVFNELV